MEKANDGSKLLPRDEKRTSVLIQRYFEVLQEFGDKILPHVTEARQAGNTARVRELQQEAKERAFLQASLETGFGLPEGSREPEEGADCNYIPPFGDD